MRTLRTALLAGVAASAIGFPGAALAQSPQTHVMTVRLPGGGVEQIRYTGDVPPQVVVAESPAPIEAFAPMPSLFGPQSPFAALDRISAEMDRQAAAMFRQADALAAQARSGQLDRDRHPRPAARQRGLLVRLDDVGQRRLHAKHADHVDGQRFSAARRVAQLRQLRCGAGRQRLDQPAHRAGAGRPARCRVDERPRGAALRRPGPRDPGRAALIPGLSS